MLKKMTLLVAMACSGVAMADVVLYGQIKGGIGYTSGDGDGSITQIEDYKSRIGFRGNEDLGNGLQAIWQVEQFTPISGAQSSGGWNNRDTFIGLKGGFGTVRAGYVSDGMMDTSDQKLIVDPWEWNLNANNPKGVANFTRVDKRLQGVRYDSPQMGGFKFNVTHQLADSAKQTDFETASTVNQATVLAATYEHAGYFVKGAYGLYKHQNEDADQDLNDAQVARIMGGYRAKNMLAVLAYQYTDGFRGLWATPASVANKAQIGKTEVKTHEILGNFAYTMGAFTPRVTYVHGFDEKHEGIGKVNNTNYDQVIVGADYALSKRTTVLASAGWKNAPYAYDVNAEGKKVGLDSDVYSVGLGMRHMF